MKPSKSTSSKALLLLKNRMSLFYVLASLPLFLILHFNVWSLVINFYGFVFLLLKNQKLHLVKEANLFHRIVGLVIIASSFFVYYAVVLAIPTAGFYSGANYVVFLFGLFLLFFDLSALKEAFTPIFFIAAATSSSLVATWLEPYFSPYLGNIASLLVSILRILGINANLQYLGSIPLISFRSLAGHLVITSFVYWCLGVFSVLVFSIIIVVVLVEDPSGWKIKLLASVLGVLGTFALNIVRITIIFLTDYFYGAEAGATVHYIIGYALFSAWLAVFLYAYSKRNVVQLKVQSFRRNPVKERA
jgi:exosortase/archaeosortase family protein